MRLAYRVVCYAIFLGVFAYAIGFVGGWHVRVTDDLVFVPKSIDAGGSTAFAWPIDLALLTLFAVQHSGMARRWFKSLGIGPASVERSTYVLASSVCLIILFWAWRPMPEVVWTVPTRALDIVSLVGWMITVVSTFLLNHFELFGLVRSTEQPFRTPFLYRLVRHPIYVGFIVAFWATSTMTVGHLVFAVFMTAYVLVGYRLEERDLIRELGEKYRAYRERVNALVPLPKRARGQPDE